MMKILDTYYQFFRITESALTPAYIRRMKIFGILAVPAVPCFAIVDLFNLSPELSAALMILGMLSFIFLVVACFNPIVNTFTRTNKNLDEWEVRYKQASESFALRAVLIPVVMAVVILPFMASSSAEAVSIELLMSQFIWLVVSVLMYIFFAIYFYTAWTLESLDPAD